MGQRGLFIVFEGIDGSGTTTQCRLLQSHLQERIRGREVVVTAEPTSGPVGLLIRSILRGRIVSRGPYGPSAPFDPRALALLFASDRLDHLRCEIGPLLRRGTTVICDRYVLSSLAYQGLDADLSWLREVNRFAPEPDLTIFLDLPVEVAIERIARRGGYFERFEKKKTLELVAKAYRDLVAQVDPGRRLILDATLEEEVLAERVMETVLPLIVARFGPGEG